MKSNGLSSFWSTIAVINGLASTIQATDSSSVTGKLGDAQVITNNPRGAVYLAELPSTQGILGSIVATSAGPLGTEFTINFANLPEEGGPFLYHIHTAPVPTNGNCTGTLGHLDPFQRGETPACVMSQPETCQVGDLAGKHGTIPGTTFSTSYVDPYVSLNYLSNAYMGNLSFVLHYANTTRITCANFTIPQGEIVSTATSTSIAASVFASAPTSIIATTIGTNGPAGWPSGVPYPPTAAPGWPSGIPFGGNGLGGWGAWGFTGGQSTAAPQGAVGALSSVASSIAAGTLETSAVPIPTAVTAAAVSSATFIPNIPGTVTGASIPHGTGLVVPTAANAVIKTSDGAVTEWSNYILTVAGLFALTLIL